MPSQPGTRRTSAEPHGASVSHAILTPPCGPFSRDVAYAGMMRGRVPVERMFSPRPPRPFAPIEEVERFITLAEPSPIKDDPMIAKIDPRSALRWRGNEKQANGMM